MRQPTVRCQEFVELVTDWEEGVLGDDVRVEIEEHMAICPPCVEYVEQLRLTRAVLRNLADREPAPSSPPPAARAALLAEFRRQRSAG
jgi:predicted anti-sigma-YlaC factor YlaD